MIAGIIVIGVKSVPTIFAVRTKTGPAHVFSKNNFAIESISVKTIYANQKSQINPLIDTIRFVSLLGRSVFRKK